MEAARKFGVKLDSLHLDSSSFHVHGEYAISGVQPTEAPRAIEITYGYSRDHRPDLKQFPRGLNVQRGWRYSPIPKSGRWQ